MVMIMMGVIADLLMRGHRRFVAVLVAVVAVGHFLMGVLMLMPVLLAHGLSSVVIAPPATR